ncbi:MAG: site-2 protease family protein [Planctomycetota bacterium]
MLAGPLGTLFDLLLVVLGFGLIVFIHELGHFIAARWARIRVLAFAVGFGPAIFSYRKGMGLQRGSSDPEYNEHVRTRGKPPPGTSPTEYRLNALPLGGYVKMLGQEDLDPGATSEAADSYQNCTPWKRLIVISAGVIFNIISAAILFVIVFGVGLRTEPAIVGQLVAGSPAATAVSTDGAHVGLQPGDVVRSIEGRTANSFNDITLAAAMAKRNEPVAISIERSGVPDPIAFEIVPQAGAQTGLLELGFFPARTLRIFDADTEAERNDIAQNLASIGLPGVEAGMRLVSINGDDSITRAGDIAPLINRIGGGPIDLVFESDTGERVAVTTASTPLLDNAVTAMPGGGEAAVDHLLGLLPVLRVNPEANPDNVKQGLRPGDVFVRIGSVTHPSIAAGIREIRDHSGRALDIEVERRASDGSTKLISLTVEVSREGTVGFSVGDTAGLDARVALPERTLRDLRDDAQPRPRPANALIDRPGTVIESIGGEPVNTLLGVRETLRDATRGAYEAGVQEASIDVTLRAPGADAPATIPWTLTRADLDRLHGLGWASPIFPGLFEPEQTLLKGEGPLDAVGLGVAETQRVMLMTYVTFARLFEGTVRVEHLKGPVGIAHVGTLIASRGFVWLLFFLALVSVNLAVINFLPLPIVDGGQFLMIVYEMIARRPVPLAVQSVVTTAGLIMIAGLFLLVTFNDVRALLGV